MLHVVACEKFMAVSWLIMLILIVSCLLVIISSWLGITATAVVACGFCVAISGGLWGCVDVQE